LVALGRYGDAATILGLLAEKLRKASAESMVGEGVVTAA
jgi:hypothetical protein